MVFKFNIGEKDKTWKVEAEAEALEGKMIGEKIKGELITSDLKGYELEITGTSDKAGFPGFKEVEGPGLKKILLKKGKGMKGWKRRLKKKIKVKGLRMKKTVRGNVITKDIHQINLKVLKQGEKKLEIIYPEQNKGKEEAKADQPLQKVDKEGGVNPTTAGEESKPAEEKKE